MLMVWLKCWAVLCPVGAEVRGQGLAPGLCGMTDGDVCPCGLILGRGQLGDWSGRLHRSLSTQLSSL